MRKKKWGSLLLAAALVALLTGLSAPAGAAEDAGSLFLEDIPAAEAGYIEISTAEELAQIGSDLSGHYVLTQDIDLSGYDNWSPIGSSSPFTGVLDGQGHVVRNLTITELAHVNKPYAGLFGRISGGTVKNLGLENVDINLGMVYAADAGAIAGNVSGNSTIANCYSSGSIYADMSNAPNVNDFSMGGLVGRVSDASQPEQTTLIRGSYSRTTLTTSGRYGTSLGGILGTVSGEDTNPETPRVVLQNCFNSGAVQNAIVDENAAISVYSGGLVGMMSDCTVQLQASYNQGAVTAREETQEEIIASLRNYAYAGGLVGCNLRGVLEASDCYNTRRCLRPG